MATEAAGIGRMTVPRWPLLVPLAVLLAAHAPSLPAAWRGEAYYGYRLDVCDAYLLDAPEAVGEKTRADGCDVLYSHRMALDAWQRVGEAWHSTSLPLFVARDLWAASVESRALNLLDFAVLLWPARLVLGAGPAFVAIHLALVAAGTLAGALFARALGASGVATVGAGVVAGSSGMLIESVLRGQYPQAASLGAFLMFFLGLSRLWQGGRGGAALSAAGAAVAALLYWQNLLLLGLGALAWMAFAGRPEPGLVRRAATAIALAALPCLPAAYPVVETMLVGGEEKLALMPWGTPYPVGSYDLRVYSDLIDEIPWNVAIDPSRGWWIPALPLVPVVLLGLWGRRSLPWLALALLGGVLVLGPLPAMGEHGIRIPGFTAADREVNPVYTFVWQWVPTASRMKHPLRWGALLAVGLVALTAIGVDRLRARSADHALLAVGAGLAWAALVGPWPMRTSPFPGKFLDGIEGCAELVLPGRVVGERPMNDILRLDGLAWIPRFPLDASGAGGTGVPSAARMHASEVRRETLRGMLRGEGGTLPAGACVLFEATWSSPLGTGWSVPLRRAFGEPETVLDPAIFLEPATPPRSVEVYRPGAMRNLPPE